MSNMLVEIPMAVWADSAVADILEFCVSRGGSSRV